MKAIYPISAVVLAATIAACSAPATHRAAHRQSAGTANQTASETPASGDKSRGGSNHWGQASPLHPPASYKGTLPCADCPGIDYQLNLLPDQRYLLQLDYQGRDTNFINHGQWSLSSDQKTLKLEGKKDSARYWAVEDHGNRLRRLDANGQPIDSNLNYELTRGEHFDALDKP